MERPQLPSSDPPALAAAAPGKVVLIEHAKWLAARDAILLASVPATLLLLGPAGTGKTWLLRRLAATLRQQGTGVPLVARGDLPFDLPAGGLVLVDEAARMDDGRLASLAGQRSAVLVLAGLPAFADRFETLSNPPRTISLPALRPDEMRGFITDWLAQCSSPLASGVNEFAVGRVVERCGGIPRLAAQLLGATLTISETLGRSKIGAADVDQTADLRLSGLIDDADAVPLAEAAAPDRPQSPPVAEPERPPRPAPRPAGSLPRRSRLARPGWVPAFRASHLAGITAAVTLTAALGAVLIDWTTRSPVQVADLPLLEASMSTPELAKLAQPLLTDTPPPALASAEPSSADAAAIPLPGPAVMPQFPAGPVPQTISPPAPSMAAIADATPAAPLDEPMAVSAPSDPSAVATLERIAPPSLAATAASPAPVPPAAPPVLASQASPAIEASLNPQDTDSDPADQTVAPARPGGPGLVLVVGPGETMQSLYAQVYRGLQPPPYSVVVASNPSRVRPGGLLVFPEPPGGWLPR